MARPAALGAYLDRDAPSDAAWGDDPGKLGEEGRAHPTWDHHGGVSPRGAVHASSSNSEGLPRRGSKSFSPRSGDADPLRREGPEITSRRSGGADPPVGRARDRGGAAGRGLEIILTRSGVAAGGLYHIRRSLGAEGGTWRSMFTRVRASPRHLALDVHERQGLAF
jgi:hypothetical protein